MTRGCSWLRQMRLRAPSGVSRGTGVALQNFERHGQPAARIEGVGDSKAAYPYRSDRGKRKSQVNVQLWAFGTMSCSSLTAPYPLVPVQRIRDPDIRSNTCFMRRNFQRRQLPGSDAASLARFRVLCWSKRCQAFSLLAWLRHAVALISPWPQQSACEGPRSWPKYRANVECSRS